MSGGASKSMGRRCGEDVLAALCWTGGLLSGLVAGFVSAALSAPRRTMESRAARRLSGLAQAVVGNNKGSIAAVFGLPPTAIIPLAASADSATLYQADTWYYPLDVRRRRAMAIQFDNGVARRVEFIEVPA